MGYDWDPKRLEYLRAQLEEKGHRFEGFPLRCAWCGAMIGVLSAMEEGAPACPRPTADHQIIER